MDARTRASTSIAIAKTELERALLEIDLIQTYDPALVGLLAHALTNYITVTSATVEMLQLTLRDFDDPDVPIWLEGIGRTADLMQHSVSRLVSMSTPRDFPLKLDRINLPVLMERACEYYRQRASDAHVHLTCQAVGPVPLSWADRVAGVPQAALADARGVAELRELEGLVEVFDQKRVQPADDLWRAHAGAARNVLSADDLFHAHRPM